MATLMPMNQLRERWQRFLQGRFWRDGLSVGLFIVALALNAIALIVLLVRLRPLSYPVPVHYSSLSGFDQLGSWYHPYGIIAFSLAVTLVNAMLAIRAFNRSRIASFLLLLGSVVVAVFSVIIANAFTGVS